MPSATWLIDETLKWLDFGYSGPMKSTGSHQVDTSSLDNQAEQFWLADPLADDAWEPMGADKKNFTLGGIVESSARHLVI